MEKRHLKKPKELELHSSVEKKLISTAKSLPPQLSNTVQKFRNGIQRRNIQRRSLRPTDICNEESWLRRM
jgi:hypothetical protein